MPPPDLSRGELRNETTAQGRQDVMVDGGLGVAVAFARRLEPVEVVSRGGPHRVGRGVRLWRFAVLCLGSRDAMRRLDVGEHPASVRVELVVGLREAALHVATIRARATVPPAVAVAECIAAGEFLPCDLCARVELLSLTW